MMGRKPKYATLIAYQPYIDIIRKDLGIPDTHYIDFTFGAYTTMGGDIRYFNEFYSKIRIDKYGSKKRTIQTIMHELRHIHQRLTGISKHIWVNSTRKNGKGKWYLEWKGITVPFYNIQIAKRAGDINKYTNSPEEIDARDYEKEIDRLFPNLQLPNIYQRRPMRLHIGTTYQGTKFYKFKD